ncbi:MAG: alanine--tRNA ligase [SAR324 cluster bacterium]|nr:alanine--tRNA ligase [SAR324 cluster bacterium]
MKTAQQIRQEFISFFESKDHRFVRSSPVVPSDDPTLLFSNAGMNQFKDIFLETGTRDYSRAVNSQKCIRASGKHNDLEDVGRDNFHHTFFEMLGNWSFGDYFKKEAISWAWELMVDQWGLPADKLWATVFEGSPEEDLEPDEEAEELWKSCTPIRHHQILRCSKKDNFWEMGNVGPCGPCSEIHIDLGEGTCPLSGVLHECAVNVDGCWRFVELWNLVFIQYNRTASGDLEKLPAKHVDTGMGLERICRVLQKVDSNYETDLFTPILAAISEEVGKKDGEGEIGVAFRVIADHLRSLTFAVADGAIPSNEGRGYVLRRMLRRATRFGRVLGMHEPFIFRLVPTLVKHMGDAFPEIKAQASHVAGVIQAEEESFGQTLDRGLEIFEQMIEQPETQKKRQLSGEDTFKLYDTFGFPVDLTRLMCEEREFSIDEEGFEEWMNQQRIRGREAAKFKMSVDEWQTLTEGGHSRFIGYDTMTSDSFVRKYSQNEKGQWLIILDHTPFYAESGGQVGDQGSLFQASSEWKVVDVQKDGDAIVHICEGEKAPKDILTKAEVNSNLRLPTTYNHTATHLLQTALRRVLGTHVNQAGSVVHPEYLRFDFTHFEKLSEEQLREIEQMVNQKIRENITLNIYETSYDKAIESGIIALFGEKYGDQVRVIQAGDYSSELCGGCHVGTTGEIGHFRILSEAGIASGVRRIVALTGPELEKLIREEEKVVSELRGMLNVPLNEIVSTTRQVLEEKRQLEKDLLALKKESAAGSAEHLMRQAQEIAGVQVVIAQVELDSMDAFKSLGDSLREQLNPGLAVLAADLNSKASLLCVVSDQLVSKKVKAGDLINLVAALADGRGGGKPHLAQAGIKSPEKLPEALQKAPELIEQYLQKQL